MPLVLKHSHCLDIVDMFALSSDFPDSIFIFDEQFLRNRIMDLSLFPRDSL